jgi:hypothetical protein
MTKRRAGCGRDLETPGAHGVRLPAGANVLLHNYRAMGLNDGELLFTLEVISHKYDARRPYPTFGLLARHMGRRSDKQLRRYAASLERKGYLRREPVPGHNTRFRFDGLFDALLALLERQDAEARERQEQDAEPYVLSNGETPTIVEGQK